MSITLVISLLQIKKGFIKLIANIFKIGLCQVKAESTTWTKEIN